MAGGAAEPGRARPGGWAPGVGSRRLGAAHPACSGSSRACRVFWRVNVRSPSGRVRQTDSLAEHPVTGAQDRAGRILASCALAEPCCVCGWRRLCVREEKSRSSGQAMAVPAATGPGRRHPRPARPSRRPGSAVWPPSPRQVGPTAGTPLLTVSRQSPRLRLRRHTLSPRSRVPTSAAGSLSRPGLPRVPPGTPGRGGRTLRWRDGVTSHRRAGPSPRAARCPEGPVAHCRQVWCPGSEFTIRSRGFRASRLHADES